MATSHFESLESPFLCSTCCCLPALVGACSSAELSILCTVRRSRVGVGCACGLPVLPFLLPLPTAGTGHQPSAGSRALQCLHAGIALPGWTCLGVPVADRACCLRCCLSLLPALRSAWYYHIQSIIFSSVFLKAFPRVTQPPFSSSWG